MAFEEILRRIESVRDEVHGAIRLGKVKAVDGTALSLTVTIGGQDIPGVRWAKRYTPAVDDFVIVVRMGESWVVFDELSRDLTGPGYIATAVTIQPTIVLFGAALIVPTTQPWAWAGHPRGDLGQGRNVRSEGNQWLEAALAIWPSAATVLPAGATVTSAKLRLVRDVFIWDDGSLSNTTPLVSPVIYAHNRTATTEPTSQAPADIWLPGYGPWRPGTLARGQGGQWDLPSTWLTAWLAGTITGVGTSSDQISEHAWWSNGVDAWRPTAELTIGYTVPA